MKKCQNILKYILFCVPQKKDSQIGLEWYEGEERMAGFLFMLNYPFKK